MTPLEAQIRRDWAGLGLAHEAGWVWDHLKALNLTAESAMAMAVNFAERRSTGEPLAYLLGWVPFLGTKIQVAPGVLVPRPETEELAEKMSHLLGVQIKAEPTKTWRILDLGAGSGALGVGVAADLLKKFSQLKIELHAVERSPKAQLTLSVNLGHLKVNYQARAQTFAHRLHWNELSETLPEFDLLLGNPPYVSRSEWPSDVEKSVKTFEPREALTPEPLSAAQKSLAKLLEISESVVDAHALGPLLENLAIASKRLRSGGHVGIEIGPAQAEIWTAELAQTVACKFKLELSLVRDLSNKLRYLIGFKNG